MSAIFPNECPKDKLKSLSFLPPWLCCCPRRLPSLPICTRRPWLQAFWGGWGQCVISEWKVLTLALVFITVQVNTLLLIIYGKGNGAPDLSCDFFSNELDWRIERGQVWQMEQNESEKQGHTKLCLASLFLKAYFCSRGYKKKTCLIHFLVY